MASTCRTRGCLWHFLPEVFSRAFRVFGIIPRRLSEKIYPILPVLIKKFNKILTKELHAVDAFAGKCYLLKCFGMHEVVAHVIFVKILIGTTLYAHFFNFHARVPSLVDNAPRSPSSSGDKKTKPATKQAKKKMAQPRITLFPGGFFSGLSGFLGMKTATYASARTANAARTSLNGGLRVAFRSGAVGQLYTA